jgi:hypothetical protein
MHRELACVEQMLDEDVPLEDIEMYIETCVHLPDGVRSALWLVAWTQTSRYERRRAVGELMAGTGHDLGVKRPSAGRKPRQAVLAESRPGSWRDMS